MKIYFASHNLHKKKEIQSILPSGFQLMDLNDLNVDVEIQETGHTLDENALIKARFLFQHLHEPCIADDSGLEVSALNMSPGVYSARYAGLEKNDTANMELLLHKLNGVVDRKAQFRTVIAYINSEAKEFLFEGIIHGHISASIRGDKGFGYDPIFIPEGYDQTFGESEPEFKHQISHRTLAIQKWIDHLIKNKNR